MKLQPLVLLPPTPEETGDVHRELAEMEDLVVHPGSPPPEDLVVHPGNPPPEDRTQMQAMREGVAVNAEVAECEALVLKGEMRQDGPDNSADS